MIGLTWKECICLGALLAGSGMEISPTCIRIRTPPAEADADLVRCCSSSSNAVEVASWFIEVVPRSVVEAALLSSCCMAWASFQSVSLSGPGISSGCRASLRSKFAHSKETWQVSSRLN